MFAAMRDHLMQGMMVLLFGGVECSAKIAMTALPGRIVTKRLLPKR
jgi:hypothetical protein